MRLIWKGCLICLSGTHPTSKQITSWEHLQQESFCFLPSGLNEEEGPFEVISIGTVTFPAWKPDGIFSHEVPQILLCAQDPLKNLTSYWTRCCWSLDRRGQQTAKRSASWVQSSGGTTLLPSGTSEPVVTLCPMVQCPCVTECLEWVHIFSAQSVSLQAPLVAGVLNSFSSASALLGSMSSQHLSTSYCVKCMKITCGGLQRSPLCASWLLTVSREAFQGKKVVIQYASVWITAKSSTLFPQLL